MTFKKPSVTADVVIEKENNTLLIKRKNKPYKDYWALPGGFLDVDKENVRQTAQRELREETGLIVELEDLELFGESSGPTRDPRGHIVSLHYAAKKYKGNPQANDDAKKIQWFPLYALPKLAFDHNKIIDTYLKWREKCSIKF